jgi:hypothetical protein
MSDSGDDSTRIEFARLRDQLLDAVSDIVQGTQWGPPADDPAVLSEVVVVMGWTKPEAGRYSMSFIRSGSTWSSKGLVGEALELMECEDHDHGGPDE